MNYEGFIETNQNGELLISNKKQFDAFFKENPNNRFIFKAERIGTNSGHKLVAYYFAEIIPKIIKGFQRNGDYHNKASVMQELKRFCTTLWKSKLVDGEIEHYDVEFHELNFEEKKAHVSEVIKFAASELEVVIEEPK